MNTRAIFLTATFTVLLVAPSVSSARTVPGFVDGNLLYEKCSATGENLNYFIKDSYCRAFILGAWDAAQIENSANGSTNCLPENVTVGQLQDIVTKYLRENPEKRAKQAASLVIAAVESAFPNCAD